MEIKILKLFSKNLDAQEQFYGKVLGFPIERKSQSTLNIKTKENILVLEKSEKKFCYHFAFLINTGSLESSMEYLKTKSIKLLPYQNSEIIHFNSGRSIYFYDLDGNIVEFIERPTLPYEKIHDFSITNVIKLNEIGLPVNNPLKMANNLSDNFGINPLNKNNFTDTFCWVGDFNGVIIVVKEGRNWLPTKIAGTINDFEIIYSDNGINKSICLKNNIIQSF